MAKSPEQHVKDVIRMCDEQIEAIKHEMVDAQSGLDWPNEISDPLGLTEMLNSLDETRKTANAVLKKIQNGDFTGQ